ncbi:hypothetical protein QBC38DRAFT_456415 [Podospora fimiseda]|uniref:DUF8212 domain-containing protein n=1 Tax=Podospora fimiseda TaxID=252190 RepID=A0AAN7BN17_9PEZI|nr:hypothetical protein QBC38DRAFT_456415 [Podospora fimiseda]
MPLLYGEGSKAFQRLQHEIMRTTNDCTLLAWGYGQIKPLRFSASAPDMDFLFAEPPLAKPMLAQSPDDFALAGDLVPYRIGTFQRPIFSLSDRINNQFAHQGRSSLRPYQVWDFRMHVQPKPQLSHHSLPS